MDKIEIINRLIEKYNYNSYLEIGVDTGDNFLKVNCRYKECVDPFDDEEGEIFVDGHYNIGEELKNYIISKILTYRMTSDEFFARLPVNKKYDIILIDGLHEEMQVGRDIINSFKHLNKGGIIVVHDCLPSDEAAQNFPRNSTIWNGSVWKAIPMMKFQGIDVHVVDCDYGVGILTYNGDPENLYYPPPSRFEYNDIFSNIHTRNLLLNVTSDSDFNNFLNS